MIFADFSIAALPFILYETLRTASVAQHVLNRRSKALTVLEIPALAQIRQERRAEVRGVWRD